MAQKAQQDAATLTLGPTASDHFSGVDPGKGALQVRVLMDKPRAADAPLFQRETKN